MPFMTNPYISRLSFLIAFAIAVVPWLPAQDFDHYQRLQCEGPIPADLLGSTGSRYAKRVAQLERSREADEQKAKEEFLLESSFFLDGLLRGGSVLFNDPVSAYLNNLKDFILRDDANLREKIQIYTLKSEYVNAFATNEGIILVTTGMLAHLRNEATLAFVLCHEIQHYLKKHGMERHLATNKNKKERLYQEDEEALELESCRYNREQEMEADTAGLQLFLTTGYSTAAIEDAYDLLLYAPYHYDINAVWDKSFLESANLKFPAAFHLDSIAAIVPDSSEDDARQTHPNISKRRAAAKHILATTGAVDGPLCILGEERFETIRTTCRFEQSALFVQKQRYEAAIFNSYLLMREYPESFFLHRTVVQALYGLARYRNENEFYAVHIDPEYIEGGHQPLHYFLEEIEKPALNVLALRLTSYLYQQHPEDKMLGAIQGDLLKDLHYHHPDKVALLQATDAPVTFFDTLPGFQAVPPAVIDVSKEKDDEGNEEYIQEIQVKKKPKAHASDYYRHALAEYLRDSAFVKRSEVAKKTARKAKSDEIAKENKSKRKTRPKRSDYTRVGHHLGIENLLVITPKVVIYNEYKDNKVDRLASEQSNAEYREIVAELAKDLRLKTQFLDPADLKSAEVGKFNEIMAMKDYIDAISGDGDVPLVHFEQVTADSLIKKYKTRHVSYMYLVKVKERFRYETGHVIFGLMFWPVGLPYLAVRWMFPNHSLVVANVVFDLKENKTLMVEYRRVKGRPNKTRVESTIYNTLFQIRTKSKSR